MDIRINVIDIYCGSLRFDRIFWRKRHCHSLSAKYQIGRINCEFLNRRFRLQKNQNLHELHGLRCGDCKRRKAEREKERNPLFKRHYAIANGIDANTRPAICILLRTANTHMDSNRLSQSISTCFVFFVFFLSFMQNVVSIRMQKNAKHVFECIFYANQTQEVEAESKWYTTQLTI